MKQLPTNEEIEFAFKAFNETEAYKVISEVAAEWHREKFKADKETAFADPLNFTGSAVGGLLKAYFIAGYKMGAIIKR